MAQLTRRIASSAMFFFCDPRKKADQASSDDEGDNMCLEKKCPTFDTLETDATDGSCSVDKFGQEEVGDGESQLGTGTLIGGEETSAFGKQNEMNDERMSREGGELREAVPPLQTEEVAVGPGLSIDLVTENVEGPDMPTNDDRRKSENLNPLEDVTATTKELPKDNNVASRSIVLCGPNESLEAPTAKEADDPAQDSETESAGTDEPLNEHESNAVPALPPSIAICMAPNVGSAPTDEESLTQQEEESHEVSALETKAADSTSDVKESDITLVGQAECSSERSVDAGSSSIEQPHEQKEDAPELNHETGSAGTGERAEEETTPNDSINTDSEVGLKAHVLLGAVVSPQRVDELHDPSPHVHEQPNEVKKGADPGTEITNTPEPIPVSKSTNATSESAEPDRVASSLLLPKLDHSEGTQLYGDTIISSSTDLEEKDIQRIESFESYSADETGSNSLEEDEGRDLSVASEKSVRFADPLVTSSWDVPRIHSDDLEALFYTAVDISK